MSILQQIADEISAMNSIVKLSIENADSLRLQTKNLESAQSKLNQLQFMLQPVLKKMAEDIAKIDAARAAKAVVGAVLMTVAEETYEEGDFLSELGSEITYEIGSDLLDDAIHTENDLRNIFEALQQLEQLMRQYQYQSKILKDFAQYCTSNICILEKLFNSSREINPKDFPHLLAQLSEKFELNFSVNDSNDLNWQSEGISEAYCEIKQIQTDLRKLLEISSSKSSTLNPALIEAIINLFGRSFTALEFNNQGELIFKFKEEQGTLKDLHQFCSTIQVQTEKLFTTSTQIKKLAEQCCSESTFASWLQQLKGGSSLDDLKQEVEDLLSYLLKPLVLEDIKLRQQMESLSKSQVELRQIKSKLSTLLKYFSSRKAININLAVLKSLFNLFGNQISGIRSDSAGAIFVCYYSGHERLESLLQCCVELNQRIEKPIVQAAYFIGLIEQCLKSNSFLKRLQPGNQLSSTLDIKERIRSLSLQIKVELKLNDRQKLKQQNQQIVQAKSQLEQLRMYYMRVIQATDSSDAGYMQLAAIEALFTITGHVSSLEFDQAGRLILSIAGRKQKAKEILQFCKKSNSKVEDLIECASQQTELISQGLKDPLLLKKLDQERKQNRLKFNLSVVAGMLLFFTPVGLLTWNRLNQQSVLSQAESIAINAENVEEIKDLKALETARDQLQQAILLLNSINNYPLSPYSVAQTKLIELRTRLVAVDQKLELERAATATFHRAQELIIAAHELTKTSKTSTAWQSSQDHLEQALEKLQSIPENSFIAETAKNLFDATQLKVTTVKTESKSLENRQVAEALVTDVRNKTKQPPHPVGIWQDAQNKMQQAIKLLTEIPKTSSVFTQSQKQLTSC